MYSVLWNAMLFQIDYLGLSVSPLVGGNGKGLSDPFYEMGKALVDAGEWMKDAVIDEIYRNAEITVSKEALGIAASRQALNLLPSEDDLRRILEEGLGDAIRTHVASPPQCTKEDLHQSLAGPAFKVTDGYEASATMNVYVNHRRVGRVLLGSIKQTVKVMIEMKVKTVWCCCCPDTEYQSVLQELKASDFTVSSADWNLTGHVAGISRSMSKSLPTGKFTLPGEFELTFNTPCNKE